MAAGTHPSVDVVVGSFVATCHHFLRCHQCSCVGLALMRAIRFIDKLSVAGIAQLCCGKRCRNLDVINGMLLDEIYYLLFDGSVLGTVVGVVIGVLPLFAIVVAVLGFFF